MKLAYVLAQPITLITSLLGSIRIPKMEEFKLDKETCSDDEIISTRHRGRQEYEVEPGWRENRIGDTDSGSVDCEMPELVIFLEESNYSFVKDIRIDMEIPSHHNCSMENCELNHQFISSFLSSDEDADGNSTQEAPSTVSSILNPPESSSEHDCSKEVVERCGSTSFLMERKGDFDASTDIADDSSAICNISTVSGRLLVAGELDTNYSGLQFFDSNGDRGEQKDNKEIRSIITSDCGSSVTTNTGRGGIGPGIEDCQPLFNIVNVPGRNESLRVSSQTRDHGESSFASVGPHSVSVAHLGPASYSRCISVQSNGNSSARSFTFPVDQKICVHFRGRSAVMCEAILKKCIFWYK